MYEKVNFKYLGGGLPISAELASRLNTFYLGFLCL